MECAAVRRLIDKELDGDITPAEALSLEGHVRSCAACNRERELLLAADRVLRESPVERAPRDLASSVSMEIIRRAEVRRRFETVGIPAMGVAGAVAAAYGLSRAINWEAARSFVRGLGESAGESVSPLAERFGAAPDFAATVSQDPAVFGAVLAFAVAAIVFLGFSGIRFAREMTLELR